MFNLSNQGNARQMSGLKLMQFCKFKNCLILHSTALIVPFRQRSEYLYGGTQTKTSLVFFAGTGEEQVIVLSEDE